MNIMINREEHLFLMEHFQKNITIGSYLYKQSNENSDVDLLCFYNIPEEWKCTELYALPNIHQFHYKDKENNIDYIWTNETQFWSNQMSGDSIINSDVILFHERYTKSSESQLKLLYTNKVIKAYLGFAKRDLKQSNEGIHKLIHAHRCLIIASYLLNYTIPTLEDISAAYSNTLSKKELEKMENYYKNRLLNLNIPLYPDFTNRYQCPLLQKFINSNNTKEFKYDTISKTSI